MEEKLEDATRAAQRDAPPTAGAARTLRRRGLVALRRGVATQAYELLWGAADLLVATDPQLALRVLLEAMEAAAYAGDVAGMAELGHRAREIDLGGSATPETLRMAACLEGIGRTMEGDDAGAAPLLRDVLTAGRRAADPVAVLQGGLAATLLGEDSAARALHARAVERARADGDPGRLAHTIEFLVDADLFHGRYEAAHRHALEGLALAQEAGHDTTACRHTAGLALVAGFRGRPHECREHAVVTLEHARPHALGVCSAYAEWGLAIADLSEGRPGEAAERLHALTAAGPGAGSALVSLVAVPHLVEATAHAGDPTPASDALSAFTRFARRRVQPWAKALLARCHGLTSSGTEADAHFGRAVLLHAQAGRHLDRARTELLWGQALCGERRYLEARPHLRAALDAFERLDGGTWADRARAELRATGEVARSRGAAGAADRLTPREREIVELVSTGATNREIAAQLVLSPRTVDHHLRQVFAKLGISSRSQLIRPRG